MKKRKKKFKKENYFTKIFQKKFIYIIISVSFIFAVILFDPKLHTGGDNAVYISLGKSLLTGKGYKHIIYPDEPPHTTYPPGYPLLLAMVMSLVGENIFALKLFSLLLFLSSIYLFYLFLINKKLGYFVSLPILFYAIHPDAIDYSHWIFTEMPFLFFILLTIILYDLAIKNNSIKLFILFTFSAIVCYYIRTIGIAMILSILIFLLLKKEVKKFLIFLFLSIVFIIPWNIRNKKIAPKETYLAQFLSKDFYNLDAPRIGVKDFITRLGENFKIYTQQVIPGFIFPSYYNKPHYSSFKLFLSLIIFAIIIYGTIKDIIKGIKFYHIFLLFYFAICLAWPSVWSSPRFLFPILPFIILYFLTGLNFKNKTQLLVTIVGLFALLLIFIQNIQNAKLNVNLLQEYIRGNKMAGYSLDWVRYFEACDWIKSNTDTNSVIVCRKPEFLYIRANRKAINYPFTYDNEKVLEKILKADYIIVDQFFWTATTRKYLIPVLTKNKEYFSIVYVTDEPKNFVLKINKKKN